MNILYKKDGKEYYLNPDGKLVFNYVDETLSYRTGELLPEVVAELDKARSTGRYPTKALINTIINFQSAAPDKAIKYIRYRLLGTASYLDVFGHAAEMKFRDEKHHRQNEKMEQKIDDVQGQLSDMQKIIFNIAGMLNRQANKDNGHWIDSEQLYGKKRA